MRHLTWHDLTRNWSRALDTLRARFPNLDTERLRRQPPDRARLVAHLAERHDLTRREARRELDDWLFAQTLRGGTSAGL
ncbi:hypothetical protein [Salipiger marinus]|uniref:Uncharacterized protein n=1 Tax=Salipiger marinus TaxID=555512 RepID=A0A1G8PPB7_9RHOB|nr:hypothetical protein [Salipiger marinus]SDI94327.1 hypothetical protein SAMN04487993_101338 [Salipiger marinus]